MSNPPSPPLDHQVKTKANLRKHAADRGLHKVGGGDDHCRDEEQPGTLLREINNNLVEEQPQFEKVVLFLPHACHELRFCVNCSAGNRARRFYQLGEDSPPVFPLTKLHYCTITKQNLYRNL